MEAATQAAELRMQEMMLQVLSKQSASQGESSRVVVRRKKKSVTESDAVVTSAVASAEP